MTDGHGPLHETGKPFTGIIRECCFCEITFSSDNTDSLRNDVCGSSECQKKLDYRLEMLNKNMSKPPTEGQPPAI